MAQLLKGKRFAILAADGFEEDELLQSRDALHAAGATVDIVSPQRSRVIGWDVDNWGQTIRVDASLEHARVNDYDGLVVPGGIGNPDQLRMSPPALRFVRDFFVAHKPVAAICHAPAVLVEAGVLPGRRLTSFPAIKTDIRNAGGHWIDQAVVAEDGLVTSRSSDDLHEFIRAMLGAFASGDRVPAAGTAGSR